MLDYLIKLTLNNKAQRLELYHTIPFEIQLKELMRLLNFSRNTEFGKKYGFGKIHTIEQFQRQLPLFHYEDNKPYFERIRNGEQNIVWPTKIKWFAKSSGTTNDKSKFIPVTYEGLKECHFQGGMDVLAMYSNNYKKNKLFQGKCITLGGSHQMEINNKEIRNGDLSAIMIYNMPLWANIKRSPSKSVALIADWEEKLEKLTSEIIHENITSFAGVPSWNLVLMKHIIDFTGKNNLLELWPNMELFMHGGISFIPYKDQFIKLFPSESMHYMETYNSSEGFFGIQNDPKNESMLLMLDYGIFYEFIPLEQINNSNPQAFHLGEVKENVNYAMVITSSNGLWRYIIGDTIKFTSLSPFKVMITGRTKHFINAFGEELIIDNAEKALHKACEITHSQISDYTAAPIFMNDTTKGSHEWIIEFEVEPIDLDQFIGELDKALMSVNSDYEAKRYKDITIGKPVVRKVGKNTFYRWFEEKHKLGGQNKMPKLSNDRKYVEEILKLIN